MKILAVSGSRADYGLLKIVVDALEKDPFFDVKLCREWGYGFAQAFTDTGYRLDQDKPDMVLVLGDRFEILATTTAAHLSRIPIAHIGGGDVTKGSYDDAMRDCISRMADVCLVTSGAALDRLNHMGFCNVHLVGSPGVDYILTGKWKKERPIKESYVVVSYQAETVDGTNEIVDILKSLPSGKKAVFIMPNPDRGSEHIRNAINTWKYTAIRVEVPVFESLPHNEFLNLIYHCDEFIGNSSAMLYEAPFFDPPVKCRMIGKRQKGRVPPLGDGHACERIIKVLKKA